LLDYDDFVYHESDYALIGRRSHRAFRIGDAVRIKVVAANLTKRQLDYEWILDLQMTEVLTKRRKN
jgi:ribonuclease R